MSEHPNARDFGYKGDDGWNRSAGWHRWKIAIAEWIIEYEQEVIAEHEQAIRKIEGEFDGRLF